VHDPEADADRSREGGGGKEKERKKGGISLHQRLDFSTICLSLVSIHIDQRVRMPVARGERRERKEKEGEEEKKKREKKKKALEKLSRRSLKSLSSPHRFPALLISSARSGARSKG